MTNSGTVTMKRRLSRVALLLILLCISIMAPAQHTIKGQVVDAAYGGGIAHCNVFISNTSVGTVADSAGRFILNHVPEGKYTLVISSIGFETALISFSREQLPLELKVEMRSKATELENVTLEPYEEGDYAAWKNVFLPQFLGYNANASKCTISNPEVIRFRYYQHSKRLVAIAEQPIHIENNALGYNIRYQMESFEYNMTKGTIFFSGYPLFTDMITEKPRKREQWLKNRETAYRGSVMHFMRSLYNGQLAAEGFTVRKISKILNKEKKRVKQYYDPEVLKASGSMRNRSSNGLFKFRNEPTGLSKDTLQYYRDIIVQPDSIVEHSHYPITADSLVLWSERDYKFVQFNDALYITHNNWKLTEGPPVLFSIMRLMPGKEIILERNGNYSNTKDVVCSGFWSYYERVSNLLPWGY